MPPIDNFSIHDLSYNHFIEHHLDPTDHHHDRTIYTHPADSAPAFQFLIKDKFLGEYKSEVDKARVRFNLGIPDSFSLNWGNISGAIEELLDLINLINNKTEGTRLQQILVNNKLQDIDNQIGLLSNRLTGKADASIIKPLQDKISELETEKNKIWTDLSNVSRDITTISKFISRDEYDTSFLNDLAVLKLNVSTLLGLMTNIPTSELFAVVSLLANQNKTEIKNLKENLLIPPDLNTNLETILSRLTALEDNYSEYNDTELRNLVSELNVSVSNLNIKVEQLQREIGSNTLIELVTSNTSWEVTPTSDDIPVVITAKYSQMKDKDVTNMCNVVSSNRNIATWNEETSKIEINNNVTETSNVSLTFTYGELSLIINIKVLVVLPVTDISCYFGYGSSWEDIFNVDKFKVSNLNGDWNSQSILKISLEVTNKTRLWICIPSTTTLQISTGGLTVPTNKLATMQHINDIYYLIYYTSIVNTYDITYNIEING